MTEYRGDGLRAARIQEARDREIEDTEIRRRKLADSLEVKDMANKFSATYDAVAQEISSATVGLVTIDEMKRTQERVLMEREKRLVQMERDKKKEEKEKKKAKETKKAKEKKKMKSLSFNPDDDEEEEEEKEDGEDEKETDKTVDLKEIIKDMKRKSEENETSPTEVKRKRFGMNPDVETKFLPDRDRDLEENMLRERLRCEWEKRQKEIKEEDVDIIYSYWDGSGHKKTVSMKKGNTIYQFLCKVLDNIRNEFPELKIISGDQLMYVKEDLIIPQTNTFYDFIVSRARGKSGPLFNFELKEEEVAEEGLHTGKVILRSWYERNKHIFPASRWEPYDPTKVYSNHIPPNPFNDFRVLDDDDSEPRGGDILSKLAAGVGSGAGGCRQECKCSKSVICEMHYQAKNR